MQKGKFTEIENEKTIEMFNRGCSIEEIAKELDRSETHIRNHLRTNAFYNVDDNDDIEFSPKEHEKIVELINNGYTAAYISDYLRVSLPKLTKHLKKYGLVQGSNRFWTKDKALELQELIVQGKTVKELSEHFGIKETTIKTKMTEFFGTSVVKKAQKVIKEYGGSVL